MARSTGSARRRCRSSRPRSETRCISLGLDQTQMPVHPERVLEATRSAARVRPRHAQRPSAASSRRAATRCCSTCCARRACTPCGSACGIGVCGACTCLVDGEPVSTCLLLAGLAEGRHRRPSRVSAATRVQRAFDELGAFQCGYCTPGMILTARASAGASRPKPSREQIREHLNGNLCRCGCYPRIEAGDRACGANTSEETT